MLLSMEVSLYNPRFAVMEATDGKARVIYTACSAHVHEAAMHMRKRTPPGELLAEIADKLEFILAAYPIDHVVWYMRRNGIVNRDTSMMGLGAILLLLHQAGLPLPEEMTRSRIHLALTGRSQADAQLLEQYAFHYLKYWREEYRPFVSPIFTGLSWYCIHGVLEGRNR